MSRAIVAIIAIPLVAMMAIAGYQVALSDAGQHVDIQNETFTPDPGSVTELDHSNLEFAHYDAEVVVKDNNGDLVDPNVDYEWIQDNGTIRTISGGALDGAPSATISYGYQQTTAEQRGVAAVLALIPRGVGVALPVLALVVFLLFLQG